MTLLNIYWVVVGLLALLVIANARKAARKFFTDHNAPYFVVYMVFLLILAYLLLYVTSQVIDITKMAQEAELVTAAPHQAGRIGIRTHIPVIEE